MTAFSTWKTSWPTNGTMPIASATRMKSRNESTHMSGARAKRRQPRTIQSHESPTGTRREGTTRRSPASGAGRSVGVALMGSPSRSRAARLLLRRHVNKDGREHFGEGRGIHPEEVAAAPAVDVDAREREHRALEIDRHLAARAEGRRSAHEIAGMALRDLGAAREDALRAHDARELLRRHLAIAVHQHHERIALVGLHHEGLHHLVLGNAERARGDRGPAVLDVVVIVLAEGDAVTREEIRRR